MILVELFAVRYDTLSVRSGEEALDKIVSFDPHLVLLDVMMPGMDGLHGWIGPGMDGFDVCRWMRTQPSLRETKVVMLSARSTAEDIREGLAAGADEYITKPFEVFALRDYVARLFG